MCYNGNDMENFYDKTYLKTTLTILLADIQDLEKWASHNQDLYNDQIQALKKAVQDIQTTLYN